MAERRKPVRTLDYDATLVDRIDLSPSLTVFRFRPDAPISDDPATPWFVPGQYVTIGLNNEREPELGAVLRPMSIASSAYDHDAIELYVRYVEEPSSDNPLTHLLWRLEPGDRAFLTRRGKGRFTLEDTVGADDRRRKIFVAAGTGLAPFVSIARTRRDAGISLDDLVIIHGVRHPHDLGYRDELENLRESGLRYLPTISRPHAAPGWTGATGRAEDWFISDRRDRLAEAIGVGIEELDPSRNVILVCGLQGTIGKMIERTLGLGYVPDQLGVRRAVGLDEEREPSLYFEQYDTDPVLDLEDESLLARLRADIERAHGDSG